jgi:hypothetical protein
MPKTGARGRAGEAFLHGAAQLSRPARRLRRVENAQREQRSVLTASEPWYGKRKQASASRFSLLLKACSAYWRISRKRSSARQPHGAESISVRIGEPELQ